MKCIICKKEKSNPTKEHIVPEGLGGSLVTYRVCKECNDKLGHRADSKLVNDWFIEIKKHDHEIKGKRKHVKDPLGVGTLKNDTKRNVIFGPDENGKPSLKIAPKIEIKNDKITISTDSKEKIEDIINIINKKLKRIKGYPLTEEQIKNLKLELKRKSTPKGSLEVNLQKEISIYAPYKSFVKIAYELGFYFLGEDYLDDETGEILRKFACDKDTVEESLKKFKIEGTIGLIDHSSEIEKRFVILNSNTNVHLLAILKNKHIIAVYIRIFSTYEGIIIISRTPDLYDDFKYDGKLIFMDAKNNKHKICDAKEEDLMFIIEKFPQKNMEK